MARTDQKFNDINAKFDRLIDIATSMAEGVAVLVAAQAATVAPAPAPQATSRKAQAETKVTVASQRHANKAARVNTDRVAMWHERLAYWKSQPKSAERTFHIAKFERQIAAFA